MVVLGVVDASVAIVLAALLAAGGAYFVAARQFSGKIGSTEASKLWDAATEMRTEYVARIAELTKEVRELRARVVGVEESNTQLAQENARLAEHVAELNDLLVDARREIAALTGEIVALTAELRESRDRVKELEHEADGKE